MPDQLAQRIATLRDQVAPARPPQLDTAQTELLDRAHDLRRALAGTPDPDHEYAREMAREHRAAIREAKRGSTGAVQCATCHRFKPRPSSVCRHCGDDPVPLTDSRRDYDRAYGWHGTAEVDADYRDWRHE